MLTIPFTDVALAILQIFLMGLAGFLFVKRKFIDDAGLSLLARLMIFFFWPCYVFYHLMTDFHLETYPNWWMFPLLSLGVTLLGMMVGRVTLFFFPGIKQRKEYVSLVTFQNSGYLPLMLVTAMLSGPEAQRMTVLILMFLIGFDATMWTLGVWLLYARHRGGWDLKMLLNPPFLAIVGTTFVVLIGGQHWVPQFILKAARPFSECALPVALLTVGGNLALLKIAAANQRAVLGAVFVKLILLPLAGLLLIMLFKLDFWVGLLVMLETIVPSAVSLSILARYYEGVDEHFINQALLLSHVFCLATIPVFLSCYLHLRTPG